MYGRLRAAVLNVTAFTHRTLGLGQNIVGKVTNFTDQVVWVLYTAAPADFFDTFEGTGNAEDDAVLDSLRTRSNEELVDSRRVRSRMLAGHDGSGDGSGEQSPIHVVMGLLSSVGSIGTTFSLTKDSVTQRLHSAMREGGATSAISVLMEGEPTSDSRTRSLQTMDATGGAEVEWAVLALQDVASGQVEAARDRVAAEATSSCGDTCKKIVDILDAQDLRAATLALAAEAAPDDSGKQAALMALATGELMSIQLPKAPTTPLDGLASVGLSLSSMIRSFPEARKKAQDIAQGGASFDTSFNTVVEWVMSLPLREEDEVADGSSGIEAASQAPGGRKLQINPGSTQAREEARLPMLQRGILARACTSVQEVLRLLLVDAGAEEFGQFSKLMAAVDHGRYRSAADAGFRTTWCRRDAGRCSEYMTTLRGGCVSMSRWTSASEWSQIMRTLNVSNETLSPRRYSSFPQ